MLSILLLKDKMKVYDEAMKKEIVARQPFSSKLKFSGVSVKENDVVFSYYISIQLAEISWIWM